MVSSRNFPIVYAGFTGLRHCGCVSCNGLRAKLFAAKRRVRNKLAAYTSRFGGKDDRGSRPDCVGNCPFLCRRREVERAPGCFPIARHRLIGVVAQSTEHTARILSFRFYAAWSWVAFPSLRFASG